MVCMLSFLLYVTTTLCPLLVLPDTTVSAAKNFKLFHFFQKVSHKSKAYFVSK